MTREEAIKKVRWGLLGLIIDKDVRDAFETLIPELRESEDEKIRKVIYKLMLGMREEIFTSQDEIVTKEKVLAYLEKQKEKVRNITANLLEDGITGVQRELIEFLANNIDASWVDVIKSADAYAQRIRSMVEKKKERGPLTKEEEYTLHRIIEYLEDETCPSEWISLLHDIYCLPYQKHDEQKEQKPTSPEDMPYITDEHFFEREPKDSFKYKLAEYMTKCCTKKEGPYGYEYGISSESILEMAKEELIKRGELQKSAEWSEEERRKIDLIILVLESWDRHTHSKDGLPSIIPELIDFVKSLSLNLKKKNEDVEYKLPIDQDKQLKIDKDASKIQEYFNKQQKPEERFEEAREKYQVEWSEDDEKIAKEIEEELWYPGDFPDYPSKEESELYDDCQRRLDWFKNKLKSLRPQPKVELSEDAQKTLDEVSHILVGLNYKQIAKDYKQAVEKLLYSRPSWKPSEEQIQGDSNNTTND